MKRVNPKDNIPSPQSGAETKNKNKQAVRSHGYDIIPKRVSQKSGSRVYPSRYDSAQPVISVYIDGMSFTMIEHLRGIWECSRSEAVCRILRPMSRMFLTAMREDDEADGFVVNKRWSFNSEDWEDWRRRCLL